MVTRRLAFLLLLALAGCVQAPPFPAVASRIPPLRADAARIYFYRDDEPYESLSEPRIFLNGVPVGISIPGGVFYRHVAAPETYYIAVDTIGHYWYPFKEVALQPGETLYVKIESLSSWQTGGAQGDAHADTFVVAVIDPEQAENELTRMRYVEAGAR